MKKILLSFALIVGLLTSATLQAQNMSRYITLTVAKDSAIRLGFTAAADGTPVRIVSGTNTQNITVGTGFTGNASYTAGSTTMTVYGDIISFDCSSNYANLTALDVSHNTQLEWLNCGNNRLTTLDVSHNTQLTRLFCYRNNLSTEALDRFYCSLPDRTGVEAGKIYPLYESSPAAEVATVKATNAANATAKNWKVQTLKSSGSNTDIATTGSYVCGSEPNMDSYITLTVKNGAAIKLNLKADDNGTPVQIVSGSNTQTITVGTSWIGKASYTAGSTTMTIYGDITGFICNGNGTNLTALNVSNNTQLTRLICSINQLTALDVSNNTQLKGLDCSHNNLNSLDVSHNTQLKELDCSANQLSSLDVSKNTLLTELICSTNQLTALDVSNNTKLEDLLCFKNQLTSLDVSKNKQLKELYCGNNKLSSLDVSKNTKLTMLNCYDNQLSSLDISQNTQLEALYCSGNKFTTATLDRIYCALPDRTSETNGVIQPVYNSSSSNHATVLATNAANATSKNWKVQYYNDDTDIPATTGTYVCSGLPPVPKPYITLTVKKDSAIRLDFKAAAAGAPVRIVSGSNTQDITVGTTWYDGHSPSSFTVTAGSTTITIYGDIKVLDCYTNRANLTAIDLSHNTQLTVLYCSNNTLTSLDLSKNTELFVLNCNDNKLSRLDLSKNTKLHRLFCYGNNFSTQALDDIYCALPVRSASDNAKIVPVESASAPNHATVLATNAQNATAKNWKVLYANDNSDIPTTGKHKCSATDIAEASAEQALTLYPNPVADMLYLSATARTIRIYDMYGTEVAHAADTDRIDVAHLPAGIYTVRADGTVAKMVKR